MHASRRGSPYPPTAWTISIKMGISPPSRAAAPTAARPSGPRRRRCRERQSSLANTAIMTGPGCGQTPRRVFPESLHGPLPDGAGGIARTVNRLLSPRVLRRRSTPRLQSMIGRRVSEATRIEWGMRRYRAREEWQPATIQSRLQMPLLPADETSLRKHHWKHRDAAGHLVVKCGHRQRGQEAIAAGTVPHLGGGGGGGGAPASVRFRTPSSRRPTWSRWSTLLLTTPSLIRRSSASRRRSCGILSK